MQNNTPIGRYLLVEVVPSERAVTLVNFHVRGAAAPVSTRRSMNLHNPGMDSVLENFVGLRTARLASLDPPTQMPTQTRLVAAEWTMLAGI